MKKHERLPDLDLNAERCDPASGCFHVTLIRPAYVISPSVFVGVPGCPDIGLAMMSSVLIERGHAVTAIDAIGEKFNTFEPIGDTGYFAHGLNAEEILARIPRHTRLIGVSCMYSNEWFHHRQVVDAIHQAFPDVPILMGGEHVTAAPEYVLDCCPGVVACALGEGEETLLEVVDALQGGRDLTEVAGLVLRGPRGEGHRRTEPRKRLRNLDSMPWPAWELMPIHRYLDAETAHGIAGHRAISIMASRGCPYQCSFCSSPQMWGTLWNVRDAADVVAEIKYYRDHYRVESISFYDLTAIIRRKWILEFCALLKQEDLGIRWCLPSGTRAESLDEEVLRAMKEAGCYQMALAPESGSPRTLAAIRKKANPEHILDIVRACARVGIHTRANTIIGFPDEPLREVFVTLWYIVRLVWAGVDDVANQVFSPYPGSVLHDRLQAEGKLPPFGPEYDRFLASNVTTDYGRIRSWNQHLSDRQLRWLLLTGLFLAYSTQYLFRPWRLFATLRRLLAKKPVTSIERILYTQVDRYVRFGRAGSS